MTCRLAECEDVGETGGTPDVVQLGTNGVNTARNDMMQQEHTFAELCRINIFFAECVRSSACELKLNLAQANINSTGDCMDSSDHGLVQVCGYPSGLVEAYS